MDYSRLRRILGLALLAAIVLAILAISYFRLLDNYELVTLDLRFHLRPRPAVTDKVVMVEIGEDTIEKLGRFPFDRSYHALLIKALAKGGARAVLIDIFFSEPHEHDSDLEDAIRESGNVYLPFVFDIDSRKKPVIPTASGYLAKTMDRFALLAKGNGYINIAPDIDGKFRRVPLYVRYSNAFYPYLSLLATCDWLGISQKDVKLLPGKHLLAGPDIRIPLDEHSNMILNFSGKWGKVYKHYSYIDILQSYLADLAGHKPILDLGLFRDKICIVGLTATGAVDLHPNPLEPLYPGMGIHAELFNSIVSKRFITRASRELNLFILVMLGLLVSCTTLKTRAKRGLLILIGVVTLLGIFGILAFAFFRVWVDLFYPMVVMVAVFFALTFYKYLVEWRKNVVLENELGIAKRIQESFLPRCVPQITGLDIASDMITARQVGGDLYNFVDLGPDKIGVMIGDVSGKGIPASLFMAMVSREFKFFATTQESPAVVLSKLNEDLVKESSSNLFVTMSYMIFDIRKKTIAYSSGGHLPPIYAVRGEEKTRFLHTGEGIPLGLMESAYGLYETTFNSGDVFVLYTDGITEAMNSRSEMYGDARLVSAVASGRNLSAKGLLKAISYDVKRFESKRKQHDDMTLVVIKAV
jgi:CHASE2 domain-containing sensor protein